MHEIGIYKKRSYETHQKERPVGEAGDVGEKRLSMSPREVENRDLVSNLMLKEAVLK